MAWLWTTPDSHEITYVHVGLHVLVRCLRIDSESRCTVENKCTVTKENLARAVSTVFRHTVILAALAHEISLSSTAQLSIIY